ncbi:phytase [Epibacterium sp. SM1979]|uniref:Phytase n=1 Tax=Tritonibacter litoralis TaxID=2662264 RepID=A0A843YLV2_9RHOB|nr:phytase [Tritonibacter litoralis]MQQ10159.1 phytase [Tritonibacter litoralis]
MKIDLLKSAALALVLPALAPAAWAEVPDVAVTAVTESAALPGDADDPAIWVNPDNPEASLVLGTDKDFGLHFFDLSGQSVAYFEDGRINNVDLREFQLGGETVWLASGTERENEEILFYVIHRDGRVERASPHAFPGIPDHPDEIKKIYGHAMARDPETGLVWALANFKTGHIAQYEVLDVDGQIKLELARVLKVPSQPEGMIADDKMGHLYVGEEDAAIWRFPLLPGAGDTGVVVATVPSPCFPTDDIEGLSLYDGEAARYLVASSQGIHRAAIFALDGEETPVCRGLVEIAAGVVDGVTETDGLAVTSANLGPDFSEGMLVMMDDQNADFTSNFKFISFADIKSALNLD